MLPAALADSNSNEGCTNCLRRRFEFSFALQCLRRSTRFEFRTLRRVRGGRDFEAKDSAVTERMTVDEYRALIGDVHGAKRATSRQRDFGPNQTERQYAEKFLVLGSNVGFAFEPHAIRLDERTTYTPDWGEARAGTYTLHEIKGAHAWGDSRVKFKWARSLLPRHRWVVGAVEGEQVATPDLGAGREEAAARDGGGVPLDFEVVQHRRWRARR